MNSDFFPVVVGGGGGGLSTFHEGGPCEPIFSGLK